MESADLRLLTENIQLLKKAVCGLQQQLCAIDEQVNKVDAEVRLRLTTAIEENSNLQQLVNPYSNDGASLADWDEI